MLLPAADSRELEPGPAEPAEDADWAEPGDAGLEMSGEAEPGAAGVAVVSELGLGLSDAPGEDCVT
ncbi:MAG TPA: hypothetical protein PLO20_00270 [Thermogutta sp.]|nr:hypothetical protein [Thermogutta sp.]